MKIINVPSSITPIRLDLYLSSILDLSRSKVQKLFEKSVTVNGKEVKASCKLFGDEEITYSDFEEPVTDLIPQKIDFEIVYEDDAILVINKPRGLVVHPGAGHYDNTLVNGLLYYTKNLSGAEDSLRPGLVHRIDKDTSGLLVVAKTDEAAEFLSSQLEDHTMHREYYAIVKGIIKRDTLKIIAPIGRDRQNRQKMAVDNEASKMAITHLEVIERYGHSATFIKCILETGRTHQIRVHLAYIKHPILGDDVYGTHDPLFLQGQLLQAFKLTFIHPTTKKEVSFEIPLDSYLEDAIKKLS